MKHCIEKSSGNDRSTSAKLWKTASLAILFAVFLTFIFIDNTFKLTQDQLLPSGIKYKTSHYLTMRDDVRIAVDVWIPPEANINNPIPTLIRATRYGRSQNTSTIYRWLASVGVYSADINLSKDIRVFNDNGYAVVKIDARGSGASFGHRQIEWSPDEIEDYREIINWIIAQPWSNQKVGAYGISYDGNAAELIASIGHPAVKAVAPLFSYFDPYKDLIRPGGQFNQDFITQWSDTMQRIDSGQLCTKNSFKCWWLKRLTDGIKPVDSDVDGLLRDQAIAQRQNPIILSSVYPAQFRNNMFGNSGLTVDDRSPFKLAPEIEASNTAMQVWVGWHDSATVDGALSRFATLSNPQQLIISPFTHGGRHNTDPFADVDKPASINATEFYTGLSNFFEPLLKFNKATSSIEKNIRYYTLGENKWKTTKQWPPADINPQVLYFNQNGMLSDKSPMSGSGHDTYPVDYIASSGEHTRWHTIGGPDVFYTDRYNQGKKLLSYTSEPLSHDTEITGNAELKIFLSSSEPECAIHAYLETISPDNKVHYLTEGILRCSHRQVSTKTPPYIQLGPYHTHLEADAKPMLPNNIETINMSLYAISALIPKGHRIRISIAGNDASIFKKLDIAQPHEINIERNTRYPSQLILPAKQKLSQPGVTTAYSSDL